jgi:Tol biopolymer transport system component
MTLVAGTKLGPYEILSPLGAGGMGEVYKAKDTRLERTVAVKVLPTPMSASAEVRQRFEREAKTISQLSHPHICALYDVGREGETEYLVMEYLEGETLLDRLAKGSLPIEQTLRFGTEIADALDKAHRQGIVHRDLKPANVMLTKSGVKLLDFGLAKAMAPAGPAGSLTALPTQQGLTQEGTILGTFQYMAPEQLEGKEADGRTDIFALGAVLYEMATGRKAFSGVTQASLISSILRDDPGPISLVQPMSPPTLDRVVRGCLAKDPEDRLQSAHDVASELKWISEGSGAGIAPPVAVAGRRRNRERLAWTVAALAIAAAAAWTLRGGRHAASPERPVKFQLSPPPGLRFSDTVAFSPDGRNIAFLTEDSGRKRGLWLRPLDELTPKLLSSAGNERYPFWSGDGRTIAFFQGGRLRRIDVGGGSVQTICESGNGFGGSWGSTGTIVFGSEFGRGLLSVSSAGGKPSTATTLDSARGDVAHLFPEFLPDGRHFVFVARNRDPEKTVIAVGEVGSNRTRALFHAESRAIYADPGYLLFAREGTLLGQRFDPGRLEPEGEAISVAGDILFFTDVSGLQASVSGGRALAYARWFHEKKLVWVDRKGAELGTLGPVGDYGDISLSPDGRRVAVSMSDPSRGQNLDVWVLDVERGQTSRLTSDRTDEFRPTWFPDGRQLVYESDHRGFYDLYRRPADGGAEEVLMLDKHDKGIEDISPDGRYAIYASATDGPRGDLWALPLSGKPDPIRLTQTPEFTEATARFSPDGRWIVFVSDETGRQEIYVQPFPRGPKKQASSGGGNTPVWSRDGREIFYLSPEGKLNSIRVSFKGAELETSAPQPLFELRAAGSHALNPRQYDVTVDGQRFLVVRRVEDAGPDTLIVILDWTAGLKKP